MSFLSACDLLKSVVSHTHRHAHAVVSPLARLRVPRPRWINLDVRRGGLTRPPTDVLSSSVIDEPAH